MEHEPSEPKESEKLTGDALTIAFLKANLEDLRTGGIVTVAMTNPNVLSYMEHWESRAEKAEKMVEHLMLVLVPFAEMAYAEPENAEDKWKTDASYFRAAGNALSYASKHYPS